MRALGREELEECGAHMDSWGEACARDRERDQRRCSIVPVPSDLPGCNGVEGTQIILLYPQDPYSPLP